MDNIVQEKTLLAKLLAAENITIIHKKAKTAYFNLTTRTLYCPVWKDMDGDLYDLLLGHEVSHALHTPPAGWHDVLEDHPKKKAFRHFLNVVEDARIERFLKYKFPGIRKPMMNGYSTLLQRGFFGLSSAENYNDLYLIDKLNIDAKLGSLINIRFKPEEKPFYDRLMTVHTWEEVVKLSHDLYVYSKKEQQEGENKKKEEVNKNLRELQKEAEEEEEEMMSEYSDPDDEYEDDEYEDDGYTSEDDSEGVENGDSEIEKKSNNNESTEDQKNTESDNAPEDKKNDEDGVDKDLSKKENTNKKSDNTTNKNNSTEKHNNDEENFTGSNGQSTNNGDDFIPRSRTDEEFRKKEKDLIENDDIEYIDVNIPQVNHKDLLVSSDIVNDGLRDLYADEKTRIRAIDIYNKFKDKNNDYIMLLVKEFEMRKAAKAYKRIKLSDSGDIDTKKLPFYRLTDDIFKKMMKVKSGKSHGLVLVMDKSGSMSQHIRGAMEQILILSMFCRKVNIPFIAFTFTNTAGSAHRHDFKLDETNRKLLPFSTQENDLCMNDIDLREILNSTMNSAKFTQSVINQLVVSQGLGYDKKFDIPYYEGMGGTPLNEALVGIRDVVNMFRKKHNLDIVNTILIHDGDADTVASAYSNCYHRKKHFSITSRYQQITIHDKKQNLSIRLLRENRRALTIGLMKWFQMTTGSGIYGFYITDKGLHELRRALVGYYYNKEGIEFSYDPSNAEQALHFSNMRSKFTEDKFLESYTPGYTRFFFIPGSTDLLAETAGIQDTGKAWTPGRLLTAFVKSVRKQQVSRVLVGKFIGMISTD